MCMPEEYFRSPGSGVTDSCELPCSLNVFLLEHFLLETECMYPFLFMAGREANGRGEEVREKKRKEREEGTGRGNRKGRREERKLKRKGKK